jgi:predicted acylesterase/phospholipase RssA
MPKPEMPKPNLTFLLLYLLALTVPGLAQQPEPSIGLVLTGGGSFGAFETGAIQAFYDRWKAAHDGNPPPVRAIAGTSTGALIGPFVALGPEGVKEVADLYQNVSQGNILSIRAGDLLPFALFSMWSSSAYGVGPLKKILNTRLTDAKLNGIQQKWADPRDPLRLVVLATNFGNGHPAPLTTAPDGWNPTRFRDGILASAISPLATPPVYIRSGPAQPAEAYLDGGVHAVAPLQALFDLAALTPEITLTQIVVISSYPAFPSDDAGSVQKPFPQHPNFGDIGSRLDAMISESSISKEVALAWAAIALRNSGMDTAAVKKGTGFYIPNPPKQLMLIAPQGRLGWNNLKFDKTEMREMFKRGTNAIPRSILP